MDAFVCTVFFLVISFTIFPRVLFSGRGNSITLGYLLYSIRIISGLIESAFLFSRPRTLIIQLFLLFFFGLRMHYLRGRLRHTKKNSWGESTIDICCFLKLFRFGVKSRLALVCQNSTSEEGKVLNHANCVFVHEALQFK